MTLFLLFRRHLLEYLAHLYHLPGIRKQSRASEISCEGFTKTRKLYEKIIFSYFRARFLRRHRRSAE
jgi:hypothetical protein